MNGGTSGSVSGAGSPIVVGGLSNGKTYTCTVTGRDKRTARETASPASAARRAEHDPVDTGTADGRRRQWPGERDLRRAVRRRESDHRLRRRLHILERWAHGISERAGSPIVVTGLANGKTYTCTLTTTNVHGTSPASPVSAPVVPNRVPDPPSQPTAGPGNAQISVSFTAPFDGGSPITGYTADCVSSNGGSPGSQDGATSPILVTGLSNGKSYTCTVFATNANGDGAPSAASTAAVPSTIPSRRRNPQARRATRRSPCRSRHRTTEVSAITGFGASVRVVERRRGRFGDRRNVADRRRRTDQREVVHVHGDGDERERSGSRVAGVGGGDPEHHPVGTGAAGRRDR